MSYFVLSDFWWVIKTGSSSICGFSIWSCHELMAGFHPRLFCQCLNANVSFCLTSHCFFLELRPFCNSEPQKVWPCLWLNTGSFVSDWDYLVEWWFKIFLYLFRKSFAGYGCMLCFYSLSCSFSFTFEFPIMWSMCVDYVLWMKWIGKLSYLAMEFSSLRCSSASLIPVQKGKIYNRH